VPSIADHKDAVRVYFEDVLSRGDFAALKRISSAAVVLHDALGEVHGHDQIVGVVSTLRAAFPDLRFTIADIVAEGDMVAARTSITGTHRGVFSGIAPTGNAVTLRAMQMFRLSDGQIQEGWAVVDLGALFRQLGVSAPPGRGTH